MEIYQIYHPLLLKIQKYNFEVFYPKMEYCSDNAAMIGRIAIDMYKNNDFVELAKL